MSNQPWPQEVRVSKDRQRLTISYDNGEHYVLRAEYLRVLSPSAEVQGHSPDQRQLVAGKKDVEIMKLEPVGNYAIRISFTDLHDTGIFSWVYLRSLGMNHDERWANYLSELEEKGFAR